MSGKKGRKPFPFTAIGNLGVISYPQLHVFRLREDAVEKLERIHAVKTPHEGAGEPGIEPQAPLPVR